MILDNTQGRFVYGLDDPYIHLAIAKNFVEQGVWGINPAMQTSSSSSPLWTMLLAAIYALTGALDIVPLILNLVFAIAVVILLFSIISKVFDSPVITIIWVNILIYGVYLPRMIFMGMEHVLHVMFLLIIVKKLIEKYEKGLDPGYTFWVAIFLCVAVRYESIIFVAIMALYFLIRSDKKLLIYTVLCALASISITGLLSIYANGWFLPNSVFLRRTVFEISWVLPLTLLNNFFLTLQSQYQFPLILTSLVAILSICRDIARVTTKTFILLFLLSAGTALIHSMIGMMVLRYFFYLNVLMLVAFVYGISVVRREKLVDFSLSWDFFGGIKLIVFFLFCTGMVWNGMMATRKTVRTSQNIFEQQIQTADFVLKNYKHSTIALNDIGAISRYSNVQIVDIAGLADNDIAHLINNGELNSSLLNTRLRGANTEIIILPEVVLNSLDAVGLQWIHVGSWTISKNVVCASDKVHFLALDPNKAKKLADNLKKFNSNLPKSVIVKIDEGF